MTTTWAELKVDLTLAESIVRGWMGNGLMGSIHTKEMPFYPSMVNIRVWLAQFNKLASNALWEEKPNTAFRLLIKHGLGDKSSATRLDRNERLKSSRDYRADRFTHAKVVHFKLASNKEKRRRRA